MPVYTSGGEAVNERNPEVDHSECTVCTQNFAQDVLGKDSSLCNEKEGDRSKLGACNLSLDLFELAAE